VLLEKNISVSQNLLLERKLSKAVGFQANLGWSRATQTFYFAMP
jgi:hypothetical protein